MMRKLSLAAGAALLAVSWSASAGATYLPSVLVGTAALISPTQANIKYNNATNPTTSTNSMGTTGRPPEIVELARALKNNPDLIYEYVHNNISNVWMYGLQKGALGAAIDKTGTDFDQAMLMVELLRQAGYTAGYEAGTITLSAADFQAWTNITSAKAACQLLSSGGIPAAINGSTTWDCSYTGNVTSVTLAHIWRMGIEATVRGESGLAGAQSAAAIAFGTGTVAVGEGGVVAVGGAWAAAPCTKAIKPNVRTSTCFIIRRKRVVRRLVPQIPH